MIQETLTAQHVYPVWYYILGVITTALILKPNRKARPLNEIVRITKLKP